MKNYLAISTGPTSSSKNKYAMFIGRWQSWHKGHRWLIDQALQEGKRVLLCIRDVEVDGDKNLWTSQQIYMNLQNELMELINEKRVFLLVIPDIESVNIGRGIGYDVIEHVPPEEIAEISATKIRQGL